MKRSPIRPKRKTPRRRESPRWTREEWAVANLALAIRAGDHCELCGKPLAGRAERAHRVRRRDGGDRLCNIVLLHPECHAFTHANPDDARAAGFLLRTTDDPLTIPVLWRGVLWCLLDDHGNREPVLIAPDHPRFIP